MLVSAVQHCESVIRISIDIVIFFLMETFYFYFLAFIFFYFLAVRCGMQDVSSLIRDQTRAPYSGSVEF